MPDDKVVLLALLKDAAWRLPVLLALAAGLGMAIAARGPARIRRAAAIGLALLLLAELAGALAGLVPLWLLGRGRSGLEMMSLVMGRLGLAISLLRAVGFVALVWALVKALRAAPAD